VTYQKAVAKSVSTSHLSLAFLQTLPETIFSQSDLGQGYRAEDIPQTAMFFDCIHYIRVYEAYLEQNHVHPNMQSF